MGGTGSSKPAGSDPLSAPPVLPVGLKDAESSNISDVWADISRSSTSRSPSPKRMVSPRSGRQSPGNSSSDSWEDLTMQSPQDASRDSWEVIKTPPRNRHPVTTGRVEIIRPASLGFFQAHFGFMGDAISAAPEGHELWDALQPGHSEVKYYPGIVPRPLRQKYVPMKVESSTPINSIHSIKIDLSTHSPADELQSPVLKSSQAIVESCSEALNKTYCDISNLSKQGVCATPMASEDIDQALVTSSPVDEKSPEADILDNTNNETVYHDVSTLPMMNISTSSMDSESLDPTVLVSTLVDTQCNTPKQEIAPEVLDNTSVTYKTSDFCVSPREDINKYPVIPTDEPNQDLLLPSMKDGESKALPKSIIDENTSNTAGVSNALCFPGAAIDSVPEESNKHLERALLTSSPVEEYFKSSMQKQKLDNTDPTVHPPPDLVYSMASPLNPYSHELTIEIVNHNSDHDLSSDSDGTTKEYDAVTTPGNDSGVFSNMGDVTHSSYISGLSSPSMPDTADSFSPTWIDYQSPPSPTSSLSSDSITPYLAEDSVTSDADDLGETVKGNHSVTLPSDNFCSTVPQFIGSPLTDSKDIIAPNVTNSPSAFFTPGFRATGRSLQRQMQMHHLDQIDSPALLLQKKGDTCKTSTPLSDLNNPPLPVVPENISSPVSMTCFTPGLSPMLPCKATLFYAAETPLHNSCTSELNVDKDCMECHPSLPSSKDTNFSDSKHKENMPTLEDTLHSQYDASLQVKSDASKALGTNILNQPPLAFEHTSAQPEHADNSVIDHNCPDVPVQEVTQSKTPASSVDNFKVGDSIIVDVKTNSGTDSVIPHSIRDSFNYQVSDGTFASKINVLSTDQPLTDNIALHDVHSMNYMKSFDGHNLQDSLENYQLELSGLVHSALSTEVKHHDSSIHSVGLESSCKPKGTSITQSKVPSPTCVSAEFEIPRLTFHKDKSETEANVQSEVIDGCFAIQLNNHSYHEDRVSVCPEEKCPQQKEIESFAANFSEKSSVPADHAYTEEDGSGVSFPASKTDTPCKLDAHTTLPAVLEYKSIPPMTSNLDTLEYNPIETTWGTVDTASLHTPNEFNLQPDLYFTPSHLKPNSQDVYRSMYCSLNGAETPLTPVICINFDKTNTSETSVISTVPTVHEKEAECDAVNDMHSPYTSATEKVPGCLQESENYNGQNGVSLSENVSFEANAGTGHSRKYTITTERPSSKNDDTIKDPTDLNTEADQINHPNCEKSKTVSSDLGLKTAVVETSVLVPVSQHGPSVRDNVVSSSTEEQTSILESNHSHEARSYPPMEELDESSLVIVFEGNSSQNRFLPGLITIVNDSGPCLQMHHGGPLTLMPREDS